MQNETAAQRYERQVTDRQPYLDRARECAALTVPTLFPPDAHNAHSRLSTPFQSVGARGLNNVSAKLLLALLPANTAFFKMSLDDFALEELAGDENARADIEEQLNKIERSVQNEIETQMVRVTVGQALKELVCSGNALLYLHPDGGIRAYHLGSFIVRRDPFGNPMEIITLEEVAPEALPEDVLDSLDNRAKDDKSSIKVYTRVHFEDGKWSSYQEIEGKEVKDTRGEYARGSLPWVPLRWSKIDGEHYGRGYVEEYLGDLKTLEALTEAVTQGSAAAARVLFFLDPNGTTRAKQVTQAPNLSVITGRASELSVLRLEKFADFRVAMETSQAIEQRLARAFLAETAIQRSGERVTAEEIRYMAGELDDGLGGIYSLMSQELQLPLVTALMDRMERQGRLPSLPKDVVKPQITAGIEALGRGHDLGKLQTLLQAITPLAGMIPPQEIADRLNVEDFIKRTGTSLGVDMSGLIRTEEEVEQRRQGREMQQMMAQMGPQMLPPGGPEEPPKEP